jgi:hypothetical protein
LICACYKEERHRQISINLTEKLKDVPLFIADFFDRYKSATTKSCNWGYIRDLLQWLIERKYIVKESASDITPKDMDAVTSNHIGQGNIEQKDKVFISLQSRDIMREYLKKRRKYLADKYETEKAVFVSGRMG